MRITAQLIAVDDGFHLWSETYDRNLDDILAFQEDIARAVAGELSGVLGFTPVPPGFQRVDPAAYDLYLQARALESRRRPGDLLRAADLFQAATLIEPESAAARSACARELSIAWHYAPDLIAKDHVDISRNEALHALELEPDNAEALSALAYIAADRERDFERALALTERAIPLAPNQAIIANFAGDVFRFIGDFERMLEWERRARDLEPLHAFQVSDEALAIDAESVPALNIGSKSAMRLGDFDTARRLVEKLTEVEFIQGAIPGPTSMPPSLMRVRRMKAIAHCSMPWRPQTMEKLYPRPVSQHSTGNMIVRPSYLFKQSSGTNPSR